MYHLKRYLRDHHHLDLWSRYDATRSQSQRHPLLDKATATPKSGSTNGAASAGHICPLNKDGSRQCDGMRDGSAAELIAQFPPPPSRSTFHSTPLLAQLNPTQARKQKAPSRSRPALLAAKKPSTTNARGKEKEHSFRDEVNSRSMGTQTPAAKLKKAKQAVKRKPSKSRLGSLPVADETVVERSPATPDLAPCRSRTKLWSEPDSTATRSDREPALSAATYTGPRSALSTAAGPNAYDVPANSATASSVCEQATRLKHVR